MGFITVYKGNKSRLIPSGAYKTMYAPAGWNLAKIEHEEEVKEIVPEVKEEDDFAETEEDEWAKAEAEAEDEEESELLEKPLSTLSFEELQELAKLKKVNVKGLKSKKELIEAIKNK